MPDLNRRAVLAAAAAATLAPSAAVYAAIVRANAV
jgi:hypothetical protein